MEKVFPELPNWTFWADEISPGYYKIKGLNSRFGSNLELTGQNADALIEEAKAVARRMDQQLRGKLNTP